ncbi:MAG TPA: alpha/beta fold hydrolase [Bryobacteraceae bacterium]|nr:alpha/beta fold hydrolase [Bryobacteraceae bacterium]
MLRNFRPLLRNPHLLTIFANFAVRRLDEQRFPIASRYHETEPGVQVLVHSQRPDGPPRGEILMIHGLEGSSNAGYMRSMAQLALEHGFAVHRTNMRGCGGTEHVCRTMYHAGLTSDTLHLLQGPGWNQTGRPVYLIGYSLGGNVALKLAGELGADARGLVSGVCAVSTPIDLAACVRRMGQRQNRIYEWRFLGRLKERVRKHAETQPALYPLDQLDGIRSVYEFDDKITAPYFGFGTADNYYETQSSRRFLADIRVPTLIVQATDDPLIPFAIFDDPAIRGNPHVELLAVEHGGHLGFLSNTAPRFWVDRIIVDWMERRTSMSQ